MSWTREFGEAYEVPGFIEFLVKKKILEDLSWHNDAAPSFGVSSEPDEKLVQLWVDHPFMESRETGNKRFAITTTLEGSQDEEALEFDELDDALEKLFPMIAEIKLGRAPGVLEWHPESLNRSEWEDPKDYLDELKKDYLESFRR